ncbi:MAG: cyclic nucleotide-binding domain-containing protein [Verrucomicrobiales bacterium]|nr:cyclic nucleotide-binding domain-containing protein [Verrucomicrobiales bacterium]
MFTENIGPTYYIWGVDQAAYGPVELPSLVNWVKVERVLADTWVFGADAKSWTKASQIPELKMFFRPKPQSSGDSADHIDINAGLTSGALRRIKIFADLDDNQLGALIKYAELINVRPFNQLVRRGETGENALFGVLEGELRSSITIEGKECPLATLGPGSIFGEISFIDRATHTADVFSNAESSLVKFTAACFENIVRDETSLALAFMLGLTKSLAGRVRTVTRRFEEAQLGHFAEVEQAA